MELGELHRTIHGRTAEREVASGEMYVKKRDVPQDQKNTDDCQPPRRISERARVSSPLLLVPLLGRRARTRSAQRHCEEATVCENLSPSGSTTEFSPSCAQMRPPFFVIPPLWKHADFDWVRFNLTLIFILTVTKGQICATLGWT